MTPPMPPPKRSPAEVWQSLEARWANEGGDSAANDDAEDAAEKAKLEAEARRVAALSDEEVDRELQKRGFDPEAVKAKGRALAEARDEEPARKDAKHVAVAVPQAEAHEEPPRSVPIRRVVPIWLIAAAFVGLCIGAMALLGVFDAPKPEPHPSPGPPPLPTSTPEVPEESRAALAMRLRDEAKTACESKDWTTCQAKLTTAVQADPALLDDPVVKKLQEQLDRKTPPP
jgi:hypothetical protein